MLELYLYLGALLFGLVGGTVIEARSWREKARSGFRKESDGRLYVVREDGDDEG